MNLIINEIFHSIQGETTKAGFPSLFIRLAGCNLKCDYCDTVYAREASSGQEMSIESIISETESYAHVDHVTVTGGEPLLQAGSIDLMKALIGKGYTVQLETNGSISLKDVPAQVRKIVDVKAPLGGEGSSFLSGNLYYLTATDELKFVILNMDDYKFAKGFIEKNLKDTKAVINFSPVHGSFPASKLAGLILDDRLSVRLNLQLHKLIWPGGEPGTNRS